jgi:hypothetical protein
MGTGKANVPDRSRLDWRGRAVAVLLAFTSGVGINQASELGFRVLAIAAAATAVVIVTNWLRGLPRRAPLVRFSIPALLFLAGASSLLTLLLPSAWATTSILGAVAFVAAAILLASAIEIAARLLAGAASLGLAIAVVSAGRMAMDGTVPSVLFGCYVALFGLILLGTGVHILRGHGPLAGTQIVGFGAIGLGGAAMSFLHSVEANVLIALAVIIHGAVLMLAKDEDEKVNLGILRSEPVSLRGATGTAWCALCLVAAIGLGLPALLHGHSFAGWATVAGCGALIWAGVSLLRNTVNALGTGAGVLGLTAVAGGTVPLWGNTNLPRQFALVLAVATISIGLAAVGGSMILLQRGGLLQRVVKTWRRLTTDPSRG